MISLPTVAQHLRLDSQLLKIVKVKIKQCEERDAAVKGH